MDEMPITDELPESEAEKKKPNKIRPPRNRSAASKKPKKPIKPPIEPPHNDSEKIEKTKRSFPSVGLEDALKVPQAIRQKNNGHAWDTSLVATACGTTPKSPKFFYMASAARDYGLTTGSRDTKQISLTELGRSILYATSPDAEREKKIESFFKIDKFKQVYDFYGSSTLPEQQYLSNALENRFQIGLAEHEEFTTIFKVNCKYLAIEGGLSGVSKPYGSVNSARSIETRSLGKPKGEFERTAFVIMPFSEKGKQDRAPGFFDEVLKSIITPAGNQAGFAIETARREDTDIIHHTIISELLNADLVIADLTDHNPNVLLELGIRLAKEKPVVLIKSNDTGPIFDVDNLLRVFTYSHTLWATTVQADASALATRISGTWDNREQGSGYMQILTTGTQTSQ